MDLSLGALKENVGEWYGSGKDCDMKDDCPVILDEVYRNSKAITNLWMVDLDISQANMLGFKSDCKPSPILLVCRESHRAALDFYHRGISTQAAFGETYIDCKHDTLYLRHQTYLDSNGNWYEFGDIQRALLAIRDKETLNKVENLAINWEGYFCESNPTDNDFSISFAKIRADLVNLLIERFRGLKKLTLVAEDYEEFEEIRPAIFLVDPIDLVETIYRWDTVSREGTTIQKLPEEVEHWRLSDRPRIDSEALRFKDGPLLLNIPEIEYKIAVSSNRRNAYQSLKKEFMQELEKANAICEKRSENSLQSTPST